MHSRHAITDICNSRVDVIVKSLRFVCGISMTTDGSEDGNIHWLKLGEEAAEAAPEITLLLCQTLGDYSPLHCAGWR